MTYIKISDPAIIDIAAWHQVIQVVNQHSDAIAAITNNFGTSNAITGTDGDNWHSTFDLGTQMIHFGRAKLDGITSETVSFPISFSAKPVVISQYRTDKETRRDFVTTVTNVYVDSFDVHVRKPAQDSGVNATPIDPTGRTLFVDWVAIGPK